MMGEVPVLGPSSGADRRRGRRGVVVPTSPSPPTTMIEIDAPVDFDDFYVREHDRITRALAVTFGDADLAREAVDEAMTRALQRWRTVGSVGTARRLGLPRRGQLGTFGDASTATPTRTATVRA